MSKREKKLLYILGFVFLFLIIMIKVKSILYIDNLFFKYINIYKTDKVSTIMKYITSMGDAKVLIGLALTSILVLKDKLLSLSINLNLFLISTLNYLIKLIITRPRPNISSIIKVSGYSFPSGHAATSLAFYGFIIYLIYKNVNNKHLKAILISFICLLIILVGVSRIYLNVHYFSDVMGGYIFALLYLIIFINKNKLIRL